MFTMVEREVYDKDFGPEKFLDPCGYWAVGLQPLLLLLYIFIFFLIFKLKESKYLYSSNKMCSQFKFRGSDFGALFLYRGYRPQIDFY